MAYEKQQKSNPNKSPFSNDQATKLFMGGADTDTSKELLGTDKDGKYLDGFNQRIDSGESGTAGSAKTIRGEEIEYETDSTIDGYRCIGATNVGSNHIEWWAPYNPVDGGILRINGTVMVRSALFNIVPTHPLQWDSNNDTIGGEVYFTDYRVKPMYFSIKDIIDNFNLSSQKYFADFNPEQYVISLPLPPDNLIYTANPLVSVGAGGGLPTGQYSYSHRYISNAGDATNWSVPTPLIYVPVLEVGSSYAEPYNFLKTHGGDPAPLVYGNYGVHLQLRVNNSNNYNFIEIRRTPYNAGEAIDFVPLSYIVKRIAVTPFQFAIIDYIDSFLNQSEELVIAPQDTQNTLSEIKRCRAIRYFYNKVVLGNIEYESRDVTDQVTFLNSANGNKMTPIMKSLGSIGWKSAYNHAYYRSYMSGERYGWACVFWDSNFSRSLATPIQGFENFQMPNKRDAMTDFPAGTGNNDADTYSLEYDYGGNMFKGSIQASVRGLVERTFECVDYKLGEQLVGLDNETQYTGVNIMAQGRGNIFSKKDGVSSRSVGYRPFLPQRPDDVRSNHQYCPTDVVGIGDVGLYPTNNAPGVNVVHNPWVFNPYYNSLGMCLIGVDTYPSWAVGFSVVRTKKAGRVVCQGMGFWEMNDSTVWNNGGVIGGQKGSGTKEPKIFACHFPDEQNGVVPSSLIDRLIASPTDYELQLVEPLGFNSSVYHHRSTRVNNPLFIPSRGSGHADTQTDMVVYAAGQAEIDSDPILGTRRVVPVDVASSIGIADGTSGYVAFGKWRNSTAPTVGGVPFSQNGNYPFQITRVFTGGLKNEESLTYIKIEIDTELYHEGGNNELDDFSSSEQREFAEPVYIVNIIQKGASVAPLDIQNYLNTTYVKIKAIIGVASGNVGDSFRLCGERNEDVGKKSTDILDRYCYVQMNNSQDYFRWINISYLTAPQIAIIQADITNGTVVYNGLRLYGTYTCSEDDGYIVHFDDPLNIPLADSLIQVRYDNRFPVYCFGGDSQVGQTIFPVVHRSTGTDSGTGDESPGQSDNWGTMLKWNRPMPFRWFHQRTNYYIIRDQSPRTLPRIQNSNNNPSQTGSDWNCIGAVRQMFVLYNCQSYTHIPLSYGDNFPNVNYVARPTAWDGNRPTDHIYNDYFVDYPDEQTRWRMGGLRYKQWNQPSSFGLNKDYSKENVADKYQYVSQLLYKENNMFYNRIAWSVTRPIQLIMSPNLKTFPPLNIFDTSDNRGQIQRLVAFTRNRSGENLYALCEDDIVTVMTRKRTLSDLSGNALGVTGNGEDTSFIQEQIWHNEFKKGALQKEMWRTFAESGQEAYYANLSGVYKLSEKDGKPFFTDITKNYRFQLYNNLFRRILNSDIPGVNQEFYGVWNTKQEEYLLSFKTDIQNYDLNAPGIINCSLFDTFDGTSFPHARLNKTVANSNARFNPSSQKLITIVIKISDSTAQGIGVYDGTGTFMFTGFDGEYWRLTYNPYASVKYTYSKVDSTLNNFRDNFVFAYCDRDEVSAWLGVFGYDFEAYSSFDEKLYGHRQENGKLKTYLLDAGYGMNGSNVVGRIWSVFNPQFQQSYMFNRFRINSNIKPKSIKFYDVTDSEKVISSIASSLMKNYHAFENYIPRSQNSANVKNSNTHLIFQIESELVDKDFFLNSVSFEYNKIK